MKTYQIKNMFLKFFKEKNHHIIKSSSLIPIEDNSLLFTNAGMNQFKDIYLGKKKISKKNIASNQYCIRTGGKHNDLKNIGFSKYHHTLFEMLGNFSFGGYFKKETILYAWEFLTSKKWLNLEKKKIWVTYYVDDHETFKIWSEIIKIPSKNLISIGNKNNIQYNSENFWKMGDTGPCGPCSEIYYDYKNKISNKKNISFNKIKNKLIEIWNLVFMQFNLSKDGKLTKLPIPSVDTGMGLERIAIILQKVNSSYYTDNFKKLTNSIKNHLNFQNIENPSFKIICDHLRTSTCLISENIFPGNEGRNYVLRKLIRRALSHGYFLGIKGLFFYKLSIYINKTMKELSIDFKLDKKIKIIKKTIKKEEIGFHKVLKNGIKVLMQEIEKSKNKTLCEKKIFYLYDTCGLPIDITEDYCKQKKIIFDKKKLKNILKNQKNSSKLLNKKNNKIDLDLNKINQKSIFDGYYEHSKKSKILQIIKNNQNCNYISQGEKGIIVLDITPFYSESGGQDSDSGTIKTKNATFFVEKSKKNKKFIGHIGILKKGILFINDKTISKINYKKRYLIKSNHTATHLLHAALRNIFQQSIIQQGSFINDEYLRFDFIFHKKITTDEILKIEDLVNQKILDNIKIHIINTTLEESKKYQAIYLSKKKYPKKVRIIKINNFSIELCGGTHQDYTGQLGCFKIKSYYSIGYNILRIVAITNFGITKYIYNIEKKITKFTKLLKTNEINIENKIEKLLNNIEILKKENKKLYNQNILYLTKKIISKTKKINNSNLIINYIDNKNNIFLRKISSFIQKKINSSIIILLSKNNENIIFHINTSKSNIKNFNSLDIMNIIFNIYKGKGGGNKNITEGNLLIKNHINIIINQIDLFITKEIYLKK